MRELKIFLVVVGFTSLVYWGVEPYAHSVMNPHVAPANFNFAEEDINFAKSVLSKKEQALKEATDSKDESRIKAAQKDLDTAKSNLAKEETLWGKVAKIDLSKGDVAKGKEFFANNCYGCHGLKADGLAPTITDSSMGVIPPDLSAAGKIFDHKFLAALILDPAVALKVDHKFPDGFIMTSYNEETSGDSEKLVDSNIADLIAYLSSVSDKYYAEFDKNTKKELVEKYSKNKDLDEKQKQALIDKDFAFAKDKDVFIQACGRCHDMKYDGFISPSNKEDLKKYLGSVPPDLSMMIRSRGEQYLNDFLNNTQKLLPGTAMPRVGLNEQAQKEVIAYMEKVGDSKKEIREQTGIYVMIFFVILSIFAIAWKRQIWSKLH